MFVFGMNTLMFLIIIYTKLAMGLLFLFIGAHFFIRSSSTLAALWKMPPFLIGVLLVGLGTSLPEWLVATTAAWKGVGQMSVGNAIGSNIANMGLILGITALIKPLCIKKRVLKVEFPLYLVVALIVGIIVFFKRLTLVEGLLLGIIFLSYVAMLLFDMFSDKKNDPLPTPIPEATSPSPYSTSITAQLLICFLSLVVVLVSAEFIVQGASALARYYHISDLIIGLTIVAVGTSLPELAASVSSVLHNQVDIAVGNVIGSNIFNLTAVLAMPALLQPSQLPSSVFSRHYLTMMILSFVVLIPLYFTRKHIIGRRKAQESRL